jgi:hypothetical protein
MSLNGCVWNKRVDVPEPDGICFEEDILPIIVSNCAKSGCHDAVTQEEDLNLTSYNGIMEIVKPGDPGDSKLIKVVKKTDEERMPPPPDPALTSDQIALIEQWIAEGADPVGICGGGCDTTNVTYAGSIEPIINNHCKGCHSGGAPAGNIALTTYTEVKKQADNGNLWGSVNWESGYSPMPKDAARLSDCNLDLIRIWIGQGAPN